MTKWQNITIGSVNGIVPNKWSYNRWLKKHKSEEKNGPGPAIMKLAETFPQCYITVHACSVICVHAIIVNDCHPYGVHVICVWSDWPGGRWYVVSLIPHKALPALLLHDLMWLVTAAPSLAARQACKQPARKPASLRQGELLPQRRLRKLLGHV